jgi:MoaA/NifB/PqqE/SkfB family radical SAM enzyme
LAEAPCGPTRFLAVDARSGDVHSFPGGEKLSPHSLFEGGAPVLLVNVSFLLRSPQNLPGLRQAAEKGHLALQVSPDGRALEAVAAPGCQANRADLPRALARLVSAQAHSGEPCWSSPRRVVHLRTGPGAAGGPGRELPVGGPPSPLGPPFLNLALGELLYAPADLGAIDSPERLRRALLAQRDRSAVPWLFNTLVNEIESRTGRAVLDSYPPEIHLSLTGRCNIECRFCSYAHRQAYSDFVTPEQVARLDFLRHVHTLRLSSGLGEPTINPHLPGIIHHLARAFPHLTLNFFTNGITLRRPGLIEALVGRVAWINVSLNAATRETWQELCQRDAFGQLSDGLKALQQARREGRAPQPLVYGSMVLTSRNLHELPRMPALCRTLGVDRFTAIPFFSYAFDRLDDGGRYGAEESFHLCRDRYDELYFQTVEQARQHAVSVELPLPTDQKKASFGLEVRSFYDFADIRETPYYWLPALLHGLTPPAAAPPCHEIYYKAHVGNRKRGHLDPAATHHLYPCLGPMSMVDFSGWTGFDFPDAQGFLRLWNHPVLARLRAAQSTPGVCRVCDACRGMDSRDPHNFGTMEELLAAEWPPGQTLIPVEQLRLRAA